jgi:DNA sulfur modification protein DndC
MANGRPVPGPYTQKSRETWLRKLLTAQTYIQKNGPTDVRDLQLITLDELQEVRRIWVMDKHELEDALPRIYRESTGNEYPGEALDDNLVLDEKDMTDLKDIVGDDSLQYELTRELLSLTQQQRTSARRAGLYGQIEKALSRHFYDSPEDAVLRALNVAKERTRIKQEREMRGIESLYQGADDLFAAEQGKA